MFTASSTDDADLTCLEPDGAALVVVFTNIGPRLSSFEALAVLERALDGVTGASGWRRLVAERGRTRCEGGASDCWNR